MNKKIIIDQSPNSNWKPKDKINLPFKDMQSIDVAKCEPIDIYKLLIGSVVPRPIAFITTKSKNGIVNAAPFSFFNGAGSNPPSLMVSISKQPDGSEKDTLNNILSTKEFVVNIVSEWIAEPMHQTSAMYASGVSELEEVGLHTIDSVKIKAPRIKESAAHFECRLFNHMQVGSGPGSTTIVIGEILMVHIANEAYSEGRILLEKLAPIARLGGPSYSYIDRIFNLNRPEKP